MNCEKRLPAESSVCWKSSCITEQCVRIETGAELRKLEKAVVLKCHSFAAIDHCEAGGHVIRRWIRKRLIPSSGSRFTASPLINCFFTTTTHH
jgi:hypothetical protein